MEYGMSQTGADALANNQGYNYKDIITHYYVGTEIIRME